MVEGGRAGVDGRLRERVGEVGCRRAGWVQSRHDVELARGGRARVVVELHLDVADQLRDGRVPVHERARDEGGGEVGSVIVLAERRRRVDGRVAQHHELRRLRRGARGAEYPARVGARGQARGEAARRVEDAHAGVIRVGPGERVEVAVVGAVGRRDEVVLVVEHGRAVGGEAAGVDQGAPVAPDGALHERVEARPVVGHDPLGGGEDQTPLGLLDRALAEELDEAEAVRDAAQVDGLHPARVGLLCLQLPGQAVAAGLAEDDELALAHLREARDRLVVGHLDVVVGLERIPEHLRVAVGVGRRPRHLVGQDRPDDASRVQLGRGSDVEDRVREHDPVLEADAELAIGVAARAGRAARVDAGDGGRHARLGEGRHRLHPEVSRVRDGGDAPQEGGAAVDLTDVADLDAGRHAGRQEHGVRAGRQGHGGGVQVTGGRAAVEVGPDRAGGGGRGLAQERDDDEIEVLERLAEVHHLRGVADLLQRRDGEVRLGEEVGGDGGRRRVADQRLAAAGEDAQRPVERAALVVGEPGRARGRGRGLEARDGAAHARAAATVEEHVVGLVDAVCGHQVRGAVEIPAPREIPLPIPRHRVAPCG